MKTYKERKKERENLISSAHLIRAFSKEQLESNADYQEAIKNGEKLYNYCGALITKPNYLKLAKKQDKSQNEFDKLCENENFLYEAMRYELSNHEYAYNYDFDVFHYLGVKPTPKTMEVFLRAKKDYMNSFEAQR